MDIRNRRRHAGAVAARVDHIVLFSGDADFRRAVKGGIARKGCALVSVLYIVHSHIASHGGGMSCVGRPTSSLELADIAPEFTRRQTEPRVRPVMARARRRRNRSPIRPTRFEGAASLSDLASPGRDCAGCCPRPVGYAYRETNRSAHADWFNAPVPSFGELDARLLVVGLAPGVRGANRTGAPIYRGFRRCPAIPDAGEIRICRGALRRRSKRWAAFARLSCDQRRALRATGQSAHAGRDQGLQRISDGRTCTAMPRLRAMLALGGVTAHNAVLRCRGLQAEPRQIRAWRGAYAAGQSCCWQTAITSHA